MTFLATVASPLVRFLDLSGKTVLRLLGHRASPKQTVTEDEIRMLIADAEHAGVLEPGEKEMIAGVLRLGDRPVGTVMTPRQDVDMVDLSASPEAIRAAITKSPHSRLPVHEGSPDHVIGIIQAKDLLDAFLKAAQPEIRAFVRQAPVIPETVDARDVVRILKESPVHLGLVHDEYGHFLGLVTTADILESIVGVFRTEEGPAEPAAVQRDDGSFLISGWMPVHDFGELLDLPLPDKAPYHTVAGFILESFGTIPKVGQSFKKHGWRFEVVDLDGRRIDKILANRVVPTRRAAP